jgi:hypothetical protein
MSVASALIESNDHHGNVVTQGGAPQRLEGSLVSADGQHAGTYEVADLEDGTYMLSGEARRGGSRHGEPACAREPLGGVHRPR